MDRRIQSKLKVEKVFRVEKLMIVKELRLILIMEATYNIQK